MKIRNVGISCTDSKLADSGRLSTRQSTLKRPLLKLVWLGFHAFNLLSQQIVMGIEIARPAGFN